jgi:hypothetical protein
MAVPTTLSAWRAFVATETDEPRILTLEQIDALSPEEKERFDEERIAWIGADTIVGTKDTRLISRHLDIVVARARGNSATANRVFALSGVAGLGKSTTALLEGKRLERRVKASTSPGVNLVPVVYVVVPPGCTPKELMRTFANFLNMPYLTGDTAQIMADRIVEILASQHTRLVIVDEVHNLVSSKIHGVQAASTLKVFAERLNAAFFYCGIDLLNTDLFRGVIGQQTRARTKLYDLQPYTIGTAQARDAWRSLILGIEAMLPLADHTPGSLVAQDMYLYQRTGGSIGSLRGLLGDAAIAAIIDGVERIDRALLDDTLTDHSATDAVPTIA